MTEIYHPGIDPSILREVNQPNIRLSELNVGDVLVLDLMEADERQLSLTLAVKEFDEAIDRTVFEITDGDVPDEIIAKNQACEFRNPAFVGSECIIEGAFTHRLGYRPWMTMFQTGRLTAGRSALMVMVRSENRDVGNHYYPFVIDFNLNPQFR